MTPITAQLQYLAADGEDIIDAAVAAQDAIEVRVWAESGDLLAMVSQTHHTGTWKYTAPPHWQLDDEYDTWQDALRNIGYGALIA